ncbi:MAG: rod shape-determining protein, partial [Bacteroidota bacterium]
EIAIIALSGIVTDESIRVAGDEFTENIVAYMKRKHNILIGERTAEQIKIRVGSALPELEDEPDDLPINGRDLLTGVPKQIFVTYKEVSEALDESIMAIEEAVFRALEKTGPEISSDLYRTGIYLTGGGALLRGLDERLSRKTKLPVHVAEDPLRAVVRGTSKALADTERYKTILISSSSVS